MNMRLVSVGPADDGKQTVVTLAMSAADAEALLKALAEGELADLGISSATATDCRSWLQSEQSRASSVDNTKSPQSR